MAEVRPDLIYDIGMCDGCDTAYYLFRGYKVLAVDANPEMVDQAKVRFAHEINAKRLTLLNVGIGQQPGSATFWASEGGETSSFDKNIAAKNGATPTAVPVTVVAFSDLLAEYGIPHYLKVDIEGHDRLCVEGLDPSKRPTYISVESECAEDSRAISDQEALGMLELLRHTGYQRFKLVAQGSWTSVRPNRNTQFLLRLMTSAAHGRLRVRGLSRLAYRFTDAARTAKLGFEFSRHSSGPWGEDLPGSWMPFEQAKAVFWRERTYFRLFTRRAYSFWYDWHATG